jgi:hypothetical protein
VAPAASSITSPRAAELSASCRLPPAGTKVMRPLCAGMRVSRNTRGSSAGVPAMTVGDVTVEGTAAAVSVGGGSAGAVGAVGWGGTATTPACTVTTAVSRSASPASAATTVYVPAALAE